MAQNGSQRELKQSASNRIAKQGVHLEKTALKKRQDIKTKIGDESKREAFGKLTSARVKKAKAFTNHTQIEYIPTDLAPGSKPSQTTYRHASIRTLKS
jgi:hypothetical protein